MNKRVLLTLAAAIGLIGLPSCIKRPKYRSRPLESISSRFEYVGTKDNVILHAKRLNKDETPYLFGTRGQWLAHGHKQSPIYPLYLSFHNVSSKPYVLAPKKIGLQLEPHTNIAKRLQSSSTIKAAGTLATGSAMSILAAGGGLYAWFSGAAIGSAALIFGAKAALITVPILVLGTPIAALIRSARSARINSKIKYDIKEKTLHREVTIYPGQQFDTLIFVKRTHYRTNFTLSLYEQNNPNNTIKFDVSLGQHRFIEPILTP